MVASGSADLKAWATEVEVMARRVDDKVKVGATQQCACINQRSVYACCIFDYHLFPNLIPCQAICAAASADLESLGQEDNLQLFSNLDFSYVIHGNQHRLCFKI